MIAWLGFCGFYFASLADFIGLKYISAGLERLVLFTYPTIVLLFELLVRRQKLSRNLLIGVSLCYLGILAAFSHDLSRNLDSQMVIKGTLWVFVSGISFAFYYLGTGPVVKLIGVRRYTGLVGIAATQFTFAHYLTQGESLFFGQSALFDKITPSVWGYLLLIAIVCTLLPSLLLAGAITKLGAGVTANVGTIGPMLTIVLGWLVLGDSFSWVQLAGMFLVVGGILRLKP